jgi:hypothetical protein
MHRIAVQIVERHGRLAELHLWQGTVAADTELTNGTIVQNLNLQSNVPLAFAEHATLAELGIVGKKKSPDIQVISMLVFASNRRTTPFAVQLDTVIIYYNFKPYSADDPLLLATHTRDRTGVDAGVV